MDLQKVNEYFTQNKERHLNELFEFLSIPSISSLSEHKKDMHEAAAWLKNHLSI